GVAAAGDAGGGEDLLQAHRPGARGGANFGLLGLFFFFFRLLDLFLGLFGLLGLGLRSATRRDFLDFRRSLGGGLLAGRGFPGGLGLGLGRSRLDGSGGLGGRFSGRLGPGLRLGRGHLRGTLAGFRRSSLWGGFGDDRRRGLRSCFHSLRRRLGGLAGADQLGRSSGLGGRRFNG